MIKVQITSSLKLPAPEEEYLKPAASFLAFTLLIAYSNILFSPNF